MVSKAKKINGRRFLWLFLAGVLFVTCLTIWGLVAFSPEARLSLKFYDVGQGDSIFIRTPKGYTILVDGGPNNKIVGYLDKDMPLWSRNIDLLVLTHPQADHLFGLVEVIKRFKIGKLIVSGVNNDTNLYKLWLKTLKEKNLKPEIVTESSTISTSDTVKFEVLWPDVIHPQVADLNEAAIVLKVSYGSFDALLTADADQKVQPYTGNLGGIEVLKVPHHGSKTAMSDSFVKLVSPEIAVFSLGRNNRYGHPGANTLKQLEDINSKIYRTDQNGTVEIVSDGNRWYTVTEK